MRLFDDILARRLHQKGLVIVPGDKLFLLEGTVDCDLHERIWDALCPLDVGVPLERMGSQHDGGYLVPMDLEGIEACFSPGVASDSRFETDLRALSGMAIHLADASVNGPGEGIEAHNCTFEKAFIGPRARPGQITLADWVVRYAPGETDLLLQMDIEGDEYLCLATVPDDVLQRFRILIVEFHDLIGISSQIGASLAEEVMIRLQATHQCVHLHPNNFSPVVKVGERTIANVVETVWLRRDRMRKTAEPISALPHPLDRPCNPAKPEAVWPEDLLKRPGALKHARQAHPSTNL